MANIKAKFSKIQKPTFKDAVKATMIIFVAAVIVACITGAFDFGVSRLVGLILSMFA